MSKMFPETMRIHVTKDDIEEGKCGLPNKCMIKLAVKRAIGGHGYVAVDATGISITRRPDYREKAFMPKPVVEAMRQFDTDKSQVRPFSFVARFYKTTKVGIKQGDDALTKQTHYRKKRRSKGWKQKKYTARERIVGIASAQAA